MVFLFNLHPTKELGVPTSTLVSLMILPQVHLRKPCYDIKNPEIHGWLDFSIGSAQKANPVDPNSSPGISKRCIVTGGVYKGQGLNQRELMTHTY